MFHWDLTPFRSRSSDSESEECRERSKPATVFAESHLVLVLVLAHSKLRSRPHGRPWIVFIATVSRFSTAKFILTQERMSWTLQNPASTFNCFYRHCLSFYVWYLVRYRYQVPVLKPSSLLYGKIPGNTGEMSWTLQNIVMSGTVNFLFLSRSTRHHKSFCIRSKA